MALTHQRGWAAQGFRESPWYFTIAELWQRFERHARFPTPDELSALYRDCTAQLPLLASDAARISFAAVGPKKKKRARGSTVQLAELYEGRIVEHGEVNTRLEDWHDYFNALAFCAFPRAKWALHKRGYELWCQRIVPGAHKLPGARTPEQNALVLFDEGGIALAVHAHHAELLKSPESATFERDVAQLWDQGDALPVPFGHALHEHLIAGLPCPFGMLQIVTVDVALKPTSALRDAVDMALARDLADPACFTEPSPARGLSLGAARGP